MTLNNPTLIHLLVGVSLTGITAGLLYLLLGKDEDDVEELVQRIKTSRSVTIEVKIPKDCVGVVIGRGGTNIKEIQDKSETKINFKDEQPDENFRVCIIRGTPEAAQLAESMLHEFISNQPLIEVATILVPQNACGRIIGRNGENIRSISRASSAKITVESSATNEKSCPIGPVRRVLIKGTGDQIEIAKALIQEKVEEEAEIRKKMESLNSRPPRIGKETLRYLTAGPEAQVQSETDSSEKLSSVSSDGSVEVYVSAVSSPSTFWVQMFGPRAVDLDRLVEQMTDYYDKEENQQIHIITTKLQVNQMVAAPFSVDMKWYRARVMKINDNDYNPNESEVEIYFVDYGDSEMVTKNQLLRLRTDFLQLRFQAIECSLADVQPKGGEWSPEAVDAFEALVHVARWVKLTARVKSYQEGKGLGTKATGMQAPCIDLFDTRGSQDISIAEELVKQGYAEWKRSSPSRSSNLSRASSARASPCPSPMGSRLSVASEKGDGDSSSTLSGTYLQGLKMNNNTVLSENSQSLFNSDTEHVSKSLIEASNTLMEDAPTSNESRNISCSDLSLNGTSQQAKVAVSKKLTGTILPPEELSDYDDEDEFDAP